MDVASEPDSGDGEWEICNDRGFIYKRRRRRRRRRMLQLVQAEAGTSAAGDTEAEQRRCRRDLRRRCLLHLRDLFRRELGLLEPLSSGPADFTPEMPTEAAPKASPAVAEPPHPDPGEDIRKSIVDNLLCQVDIQEAILRKLSESCDYVESLCNEKEERLLESLMGLPIWGSPRSLLLSLSE